jgi:transcriptional regulator with XRE-family HTH domain
MVTTADKVRTLSMEIGRRLKQAREEARKSQLQVAVYLGVSDKTVSGYESGRITPPIDKLVALGDFFKKPITYFLGEDPKDYRVASRLRAVEVSMTEIKQQLKEIRLIAQAINLDE